jgi:hypothetical protein
MPPAQTRPIALQLVLLPAFAEDATVETPAQEVLNFSEQNCAVRKLDKRTTFEYPLSGLPLRRSKPVKEGWWLRGAGTLLTVLVTTEMTSWTKARLLSSAFGALHQNHGAAWCRLRLLFDAVGCYIEDSNNIAGNRRPCCWCCCCCW